MLLQGSGPPAKSPVVRHSLWKQSVGLLALLTCERRLRGREQTCRARSRPLTDVTGGMVAAAGRGCRMRQRGVI